MSERTPQQAYLGLQKLARSHGRNTQQLFELYIHERFVARLAASRFAERFVLKGGMLLAVLDVRRATRDADMLALGLASDADNLRTVVGEILTIPIEDGVSFNPAGISITSIVVLCRVGGLSRFLGISDLKIPHNQANAGFSPSMSCRAKPDRSRRVDKVLLRAHDFINARSLGWMV